MSSFGGLDLFCSNLSWWVVMHKINSTSWCISVAYQWLKKKKNSLYGMYLHFGPNLKLPLTTTFIIMDHYPSFTWIMTQYQERSCFCWSHTLLPGKLLFHWPQLLLHNSWKAKKKKKNTIKNIQQHYVLFQPQDNCRCCTLNTIIWKKMLILSPFKNITSWEILIKELYQKGRRGNGSNRKCCKTQSGANSVGSQVYRCTNKYQH